MDGWNPINNGINHLSTGAGFLPSTVSLQADGGSNHNWEAPPCASGPAHGGAGDHGNSRRIGDSMSGWWFQPLSKIFVNFATLRLNASRAVKRARVCLPLSPLYATDNKQTVLHCICTCRWCTARRHRSGANQSHEAGIDTQQQRKPQKQVGTMVSTQLPSIQAAVHLSQNKIKYINSSTGGCNTITCVDQKTARAAWSKLKPWAVPGMDNQTPTERKCTAQIMTCRSQTPTCARP